MLTSNLDGSFLNLGWDILGLQVEYSGFPADYVKTIFRDCRIKTTAQTMLIPCDSHTDGKDVDSEKAENHLSAQLL